VANNVFKSAACQAQVARGGQTFVAQPLSLCPDCLDEKYSYMMVLANIYDLCVSSELYSFTSGESSASQSFSDSGSSLSPLGANSRRLLLVFVLLLERLIDGCCSDYLAHALIQCAHASLKCCIIFFSIHPANASYSSLSSVPRRSYTRRCPDDDGVDVRVGPLPQ
jgi:hypothetical protein